jgi:hypothetical protein
MARAQHRQDDEPPDSSQPDVGRPPSPWREVPLGSWNDWRWQLTHRLRSVEDFARVVNLTAVEAFVALDGLDVGRVDFRLDAAGRPNRVEINTLPGLNPTRATWSSSPARRASPMSG